MDSSYDHTVLLEMTLLWSRFAKHAAKIATPEELPKHIIGRPKLALVQARERLPARVEICTFSSF
jgi:hypothetical protein